MIMHFTDSISSYILELFSKIDLTYKEIVEYDENPDLNDLLDDENPIEGISYSRALYDQDNVAYMERLNNMLDE